jgi:WD40 repeat protein
MIWPRLAVDVELAGRLGVDMQRMLTVETRPRLAVALFVLRLGWDLLRMFSLHADSAETCCHRIHVQTRSRLTCSNSDETCYYWDLLRTNAYCRKFSELPVHSCTMLHKSHNQMNSSSSGTRSILLFWPCMSEVSSLWWFYFVVVVVCSSWRLSPRIRAFLFGMCACGSSPTHCFLPHSTSVQPVLRCGFAWSAACSRSCVAVVILRYATTRKLWNLRTVRREITSWKSTMRAVSRYVSNV